MKVELLYVDGCPNVAATRAVVEDALARRGLKIKVQTVLVPDAHAARQRNFAGSPTVLINGRDLEPASPRSVACRIYANGTGVPSREACERAIALALGEEGESWPRVL